MSKRILVMEDEKDNRQIIRDMLGGIDCEITEAEDPEQALAAIAKERPDLILLGIHLPIMNGYTVTLTLRRFAKRSQEPTCASCRPRRLSSKAG